MCFQPGQLANRVINVDSSAYSLAGMVNPTFQNQGTAWVQIDGRKVLPGESYAINVPNVELQNAIAISFENDNTKSKLLYVGFVTLIK